ncbi:type IX secretion system membrane protein PorP/SprF [Zobellia galactanivorans]|uniref:PorP/SprF family type IX secretion system membrane protein n=1 Tax=Zobellia galactanivorans (strain DSM 12802 / CCUG 47099 / CIP 106680 / NCIMB 13871 / Dsij) TaxID=63186 RepID=UPI001C071BDD|nr:type IX secretion system membrane protein PorP/SprF [Zobellia galactanivorans]MBU3025494.1 type IX secretion system membrane protein PorP/SprF [Zobellia galactanivorans]MDO6810289.1 type IX secretion system membrane protein PorP/SprF [Zobellia galactanivorans]
MKSKITKILFLLCTMPFCFGQQDAQFTQYMYNTLSVNPAYAGSREALGVSVLHRSQWVGLDGAPSTQTFNIQSPYKDKMGLGLSIVHDEIGNNTNQNTSFDVAFSYSVQTSEKYKLSFGVTAGGHLLNVDFNKLRNYSASLAPSVENELYKKFSPNIGAGVYFHSNKFYVGLSVPGLLETEHFQNPDDEGSVIASERMNFYLISGYVFDLNPTLKFKPAYLIKAVAGAPLQVDLSANFLINEKFTLGAAYRLDAAISALFGFQMGKKLMLGLAYDREISELGGTQFNDGSFEIFLRYEFIKNNKIDLTPRFF